MATQTQPDQDLLEEVGQQRTRLTVDITPEMRRRIRLAAAREDLTLRDYVERILEESVPSLRVLAPDEAVVLHRRPVSAEAVDRLLAARDVVMQGVPDHRFTDDSTDLLRQAREERLAEL